MKNPYITVLGLSTLSLGACNASPPASSPVSQPDAMIVNPPPTLPPWDAVAPPTEGAKAELIVTPNGCYKNFVAEDTEPNDRYEEKSVSAKSAQRIQCPERAKDISKAATETSVPEQPPKPIKTNPPRPPKQPEPPPPG